MGRPGYREFHGFKRTIFGRGIATKHLLDYAQAQELAGEFSTLIEDGGIGVLIGEVGIGKTTALRAFLDGTEERACKVCYQGSSKHSLSVLQEMVAQMGYQPAHLRASCLRQFTGAVSRLWTEQRKKTLLILDDAQTLEESLLEDLRLSTNFEFDSSEPLALLLIGHRYRLTGTHFGLLFDNHASDSARLSPKAQSRSHFRAYSRADLRPDRELATDDLLYCSCGRFQEFQRFGSRLRISCYRSDGNDDLVALCRLSKFMEVAFGSFDFSLFVLSGHRLNVFRSESHQNPSGRLVSLSGGSRSIYRFYHVVQRPYHSWQGYEADEHPGGRIVSAT